MKMWFDMIVLGFNYEFDEGGIIVEYLKIVLKRAKSVISLKNTKLCMYYCVPTRECYLSQIWGQSDER